MKSFNIFIKKYRVFLTFLTKTFSLCFLKMFPFLPKLFPQSSDIFLKNNSKFFYFSHQYIFPKFGSLCFLKICTFLPKLFSSNFPFSKTFPQKFGPFSPENFYTFLHKIFSQNSDIFSKKKKKKYYQNIFPKVGSLCFLNIFTFPPKICSQIILLRNNIWDKIYF